ncbi:uncharacterized protein J4E84_008632 [Alternaria hordeiaustralica]|uniref:uncharacterized protein n=1 Tax=Alternaria hordeiaustralica TaxID=1187925 RepID=UPI0020C2F4A6|nr:uncharacterized protein J4E84_008632 [Alternaria hordeiaustralica]KAI4678813.1 hypothetical protein J4E84_008632 [Alternaria hordeiaustralica]
MSSNEASSHVTDECQIDVKFEHGASGQNWIETVSCIITVHDDDELSGIDLPNIFLIDRTKATDFYEQLKKHENPTVQQLVGLFDEHGLLRNRHKEYCAKKGAGAWSSKLDDGRLLLLDGKEIHYMVQGGTLTESMLQDTIKIIKARVGESLFTLAAPMSVLSSDALIALGFRCVYGSEYYALSPDEDRSSRSSAAANDSTPEPSQPPRMTPELMGFLQAAIMMPDDLFCAAHLELEYDNIGTNDPKWRQLIFGNTILHIVATAMKPECTAWIIARCPDLCSVGNARGHTPLQALETVIQEEGATGGSRGMPLRSRNASGRLSDVAKQTLALLRD